MHSDWDALKKVPSKKHSSLNELEKKLYLEFTRITTQSCIESSSIQIKNQSMYIFLKLNNNILYYIISIRLGPFHKESVWRYAMPWIPQNMFLECQQHGKIVVGGV